MIEAQLTAGYSSASAFREAFAKLMGLKPSDFTEGAETLVDWIDTPLGPMILVCQGSDVRMLEFVERKNLGQNLHRLHKEKKGAISFSRNATMDLVRDQLAEYFSGNRAQFELPLAQTYGTEFQRDVWAALRDIPAGETMTYAGLAQAIGRPSSTRAVANANAANQIALIIPCHRVIGADGTLTGYAGGLWRKQKLIETETAYTRK